jgi:iron complex transport system substrate-binding protein
MVSDGLGNEMVLEHRPVRIASVTLMTDEILLDLVDEERLLAVTTTSMGPDVSNVADRVDEIPNRVILNVEVLIDLEPDLIFLASWSKPESVLQLRDAGIPVYLLDSPVTIEAVKDTVRAVAAVVGEEERGEEIVLWMEGVLADVEKRLSGQSQIERLTVMDYNMTYGNSFGRGSSWDDIVNYAGLINATAKLEADSWGTVPISQEILLELNPDILVLPGWVWGDPEGAQKAYQKFVSDPALKVLDAVKNDRVYLAEESHRAATSQYIVLAVRDLAAFAYPGLYE